jgi:hypothetical protein
MYELGYVGGGDVQRAAVAVVAGDVRGSRGRRVGDGREGEYIGRVQRVGAR